MSLFLLKIRSFLQASIKEQKKLADKERKLLEKAHREKESALRDDDNVFDVAFENQGASAADIISATDIKVLLQHLKPSQSLQTHHHCSTACLLTAADIH